ncbi:uncharacterized protein LOC130686971 [Daphnia carinata]|uniref:uncharacterized protein LOC130686971 n=1 Tax=Daphnia carinata TaxID=120202 RepID=UPI0025794773|nr:uncharacterized protein LOC130686971 [Daphnia carinata]
MSLDVVFEVCLTCGCTVEISLLEVHTATCVKAVERSTSTTARRPMLAVDIDLLKGCLDQRVPVAKIAELLKISRRTLFRVLKETHLTARPNYTKISDEQLDTYLTNMLRCNPQFGLQMFKGCTISKNVVLKQKQLRASYGRVRQMENAPMIQRIKRRVYKVRAPLSLWHIDVHHKMDRYGFIIHGAIDGYSRLIAYISLENDNFSETVIGLFEKAVNEWGCPASVRSDHDGENVRVIRKSFRTGSSVHNQLVERLWSDAIERCTDTFMNIFE